MKIAMLSDIHLGDSDSLFDTQTYQQTFAAIKTSAAKDSFPCDVLILNGDILDFAITSFQVSCAVAQTFFQYIYDNRLAKLILYIPGNHDKYVWDALQWQIRVIKPMLSGNLPEPFHTMNPAYIDYRDPDKIHLPLMTSHPVFDMQVDLLDAEIGDTFISRLVKQEPDRPFKLLVVYPMVFINTNTKPGVDLKANDLIMVTHGQMMELGAQLITELLRGYTIKTTPPNPDIKCDKYSFSQLEQYNYLFNSLINTDSGQAGDVSKLLFKIEQMVRAYDPALRARLKPEVKRLFRVVRPNLLKILFSPFNRKGSHFSRTLMFFRDKINKRVVERILSWAESAFINSDTLGKPSDYEMHFKVNPDSRNYFESFMSACCQVLTEQFSEMGHSSPACPGHIIFGHTHKRIDIKDGDSRKVHFKGTRIAFYNTGCWLQYISLGAIVYTIDDAAVLHDYPFQKDKL